MSTRLLFSHPTGAANVRAALVALLEAGILEEFHTSIATYSGTFWDRPANSHWAREFRRHTFDERLRPITVQHPSRELGRLVASRLHLLPLVRREKGPFCVDAVYRAQDRCTARRLRRSPRQFTGVYAYEDGALQTLTAAYDMNLNRIYELPIAYWQTLHRLLSEEAQRLPEWAGTLDGGINDSAEKLERKSRELDLAEMVICPSQFVARSLPDDVRQQKKIIVAMFGSPPSGEKERSRKNDKLRVLFAGSMTQRKGLGDLLTAMRILNRQDIELVVLGSPAAPLEFYRNQFANFTYEVNRPNEEVLALMRQCDVFCLPSIAEGRALVMQEAMSQGLPLIITPNTGGEDLIQEGVTGFLVPIRRPDVIAEKIAWFADHRSTLPDFSRAAQKKAAELTWNGYGQTIARSILDLPHS
ncbi:MAG TPA: glycosyltransferase family 4 protein [Verrucomicrobiae bacterium]